MWLWQISFCNVCFKLFVLWILASGNLKRSWGIQRTIWLVNPWGTTVWTLHISDNSKKPSKQSLVMEFNRCLRFVYDFHDYVCSSQHIQSEKRLMRPNPKQQNNTNMNINSFIGFRTMFSRKDPISC